MMTATPKRTMSTRVGVVEQEPTSSALTVDVDSFMLALESEMDDVGAANFAAFGEVEEKRAGAGK